MNSDSIIQKRYTQLCTTLFYVRTETCFLIILFVKVVRFIRFTRTRISVILHDLLQ